MSRAWLALITGLLFGLLFPSSLHAERFRLYAPTQHRNGDRPLENVSGRFDAAHLDLGMVGSDEINQAVGPYVGLLSGFTKERPPTVMIWFSPDRTPEQQQKAKEDAIREMEDLTEKHLGVRITPKVEWGFMDKKLIGTKAQAQDLEQKVDQAANTIAIPRLANLFRKRGKKAVADAMTALEAERTYGMDKGAWQATRFWNWLSHPSYNDKALDPYVYSTGAITGGVRASDIFKNGIRIPSPNEAAVLIVDPMISILYNKFIEKINDYFDRSEVPLVWWMLGKDSPLLQRVAPKLNDLYREKTGQFREWYKATTARNHVERERNKKIQFSKNMGINLATINMPRQFIMTYLLSPAAITKALVGGWLLKEGGDAVAITAQIKALEKQRQTGHITGSRKRAIIGRNNVFDRAGTVMTAIPGAYLPGMAVIGAGTWAPIAYDVWKANRLQTRTDRFLLVDEDVMHNHAHLHDTEAGTEYPIKAHDRPHAEVVAEVRQLGKINEPPKTPGARPSSAARRIICAIGKLAAPFGAGRTSSGK